MYYTRRNVFIVIGLIMFATELALTMCNIYTYSSTHNSIWLSVVIMLYCVLRVVYIMLGTLFLWELNKKDKNK